MLSGFLKRALVAPLLLGTLLLPLGTCAQSTQKSAHSCCAPASHFQNTAQGNCCTVRPSDPAILVAPSLPGPAQSNVDLAFLPQDHAVMQPVFASRVTIVPRGSPPSASQLRI
jgi:hypothetical protein